VGALTSRPTKAWILASKALVSSGVIVGFQRLWKVVLAVYPCTRVVADRTARPSR
jgi:hypothetical protein